MSLQCTIVTDRQTDRQTDGRTYTYHMYRAVYGTVPHDVNILLTEKSTTTTVGLV